MFCRKCGTENKPKKDIRILSIRIRKKIQNS